MATRIGLITTGKCEQLGLPASLSRAFAGSKVSFELCLQAPLDSFTSSHLTYPSPKGSGPTLLDKLVAAMAASISVRKPPDFVVAIDDLELVNVDTPQHVISLVRDAVIASPQRRTHKEVERFAERCSLHLLCPMVEAYFYGEPASLTRAGAVRDAILDPAQPLESMAAAELAFLVPEDEADHPWRTPDRRRHPKHYLRFLNDPEDRGDRRYRETKQGVAALKCLDWCQVFAHPPPGLAFAHALFEDLSDAIGVPCPFPGVAHPLTSRRAGGVLRNL